MNKAILTGASGLVGMSVAKALANMNVDLLCLGRKRFGENEVAGMFGSRNVRYACLAMENIDALQEVLDQVGWRPGDSCVFFHFAWGGNTKLTDGDFRDQFANAIHSARAVQAAKQVGCCKFVNAGTMEETLVDAYMKGERRAPYPTPQTHYALSKIAARDMCRMVAYLEKIDYVHTRLSVPLDENLRRGGYVCSALQKILRGEAFERPNNNQLFDIVLTRDVADAYVRIGQKGKNKADYFIGSSHPRTLVQYFEICEAIRNGNAKLPDSRKENDVPDARFSIEDLVRDTGFLLSLPFERFIRSQVQA